ncbi:unnamed protein product [Arctogadus glacialis]
MKLTRIRTSALTHVTEAYLPALHDHATRRQGQVCMSRLRRSRPGRDGVGTKVKDPTGLWKREVGPVRWEEGGYFMFDGTEKASGVTAGSKGLKKGPCSLLYMGQVCMSRLRRSRPGRDGVGTKVKDPTGLWKRENGPVWLEEGGHFPFNGPKKPFGVAAGSKGLEKGPGGLLYVMG